MLRPGRLCCLLGRERALAPIDDCPGLPTAQAALSVCCSIKQSGKALWTYCWAQEGRYTYSKTPVLLFVVSAMPRRLYDRRKVEVPCFRRVGLWVMPGLLCIYPPLEAHSVCLVRHSATAAVGSEPWVWKGASIAFILNSKSYGSFAAALGQGPLVTLVGRGESLHVALTCWGEAKALRVHISGTSA